MINITHQIEGLHAAYERLTGFRCQLNFDRLRLWEAFMGRFTAEDLELVITSLRQRIKRGERQPGCLKLRNLVWDLNAFEEELNEARAIERNFRPPTNKESVLAATGRTERSTKEVRHAGTIATGWTEQSSRAFSNALKKCREEL